MTLLFFPGTLGTFPDFQSSGSTTMGERYAFKFTPATSFSVGSIRFKCKNLGSPAGSLQAYIYANDGTLNVPTGAALATSTNTCNASILSTSYSYLYFRFATPYTVTASTIYWVVVTTSGYTYADGTTEVVMGVGSSEESTTLMAIGNTTPVWDPIYYSADYEVYDDYTSLNTALTCGAAVKVTTASFPQTIIYSAQWDPNTSTETIQYQLNIILSGSSFYPRFTIGTTVITSTVAMVLDTWHRVVATAGSSIMRLYLDGVLVASALYSAPSLASCPLTIGSWSPIVSATQKLRGYADEVFLTSDVWTQSEVELDYLIHSTNNPFVDLQETRFIDTFSRANSAVTMGNLESGEAWSVLGGTWGISSQRAYSVSNADANAVVVDVSAEDITMTCKMTGGVLQGASELIPMIVFRCADSTHYWYVLLAGDVLTLGYNYAGGTAVGSYTATFDNGTFYTVKVIAVGSSISVYLDSVLRISYTANSTLMALYAGNTKCGMVLSKTFTPTGAVYWDDFVVTVP